MAVADVPAGALRWERRKASGTPAPFVDEHVPFGEFTDLIGLPESADPEHCFSG